MYQLPLRFISVGSDVVICATRIIGIFNPQTVYGKRLMRSARENNNLIDVRGGRGLRSLILLDNDGVVASSIHPITLFKRIEDGEKVYIKSMASIKETMKKAYITRAKEDGIVIVDKDDYEQLEKDLTSKENRVQRMNDLKGFKK